MELENQELFAHVNMMNLTGPFAISMQCLSSSLFAERNYLSLHFLTIFSFVVLLTSKQLTRFHLDQPICDLFTIQLFMMASTKSRRRGQSFSQIVDDFQRLPEDLPTA